MSDSRGDYPELLEYFPKPTNDLPIYEEPPIPPVRVRQSADNLMPVHDDLLPETHPRNVTSTSGPLGNISRLGSQMDRYRIPSPITQTVKTQLRGDCYEISCPRSEPVAKTEVGVKQWCSPNPKTQPRGKPPGGSCYGTPGTTSEPIARKGADVRLPKGLSSPSLWTRPQDTICTDPEADNSPSSRSSKLQKSLSPEKKQHGVSNAENTPNSCVKSLTHYTDVPRSNPASESKVFLTATEDAFFSTINGSSRYYSAADPNHVSRVSAVEDTLVSDPNFLTPNDTACDCSDPAKLSTLDNFFSNQTSITPYYEAKNSNNAFAFRHGESNTTGVKAITKHWSPCPFVHLQENQHRDSVINSTKLNTYEKQPNPSPPQSAKKEQTQDAADNGLGLKILCKRRNRPSPRSNLMDNQLGGTDAKFLRKPSYNPPNNTETTLRRLRHFTNYTFDCLEVASTSPRMTQLWNRVLRVRYWIMPYFTHICVIYCLFVIFSYSFVFLSSLAYLTTIVIIMMYLIFIATISLEIR